MSLGGLGALALPHVRLMQARAAQGLCPFGNGSPVRQVMRSGTLGGYEAPAGAPPAQRRAALGLELDSSKGQDVAGWARTHGLECHARMAVSSASRTLECVASAPGRLGPAWVGAEGLTVVLDVDGKQMLRAIRALGRFATPDAAAEAMATLEADTAQAIGGAAEPHPPIAPAAWQAGLLSQVQVTFRRTDLYAALTGTRLSNQISVQQLLRAL